MFGIYLHRGSMDQSFNTYKKVADCLDARKGGA